MMNVLAPLNDLSAYQSLVNAGATELYVGFASPAWYERFQGIQELNRLSGFAQQANALSLEDVITLAGWCKRDGVKLFVTFNAASYTQEAADFIAAEFFPRLAQAQIAGVIIASPQLAPAAQAAGIPCVASCLCDISNHYIAQEYANLGFSRLVLPRHLTLEEIAEIIRRVPGVEYEAFAMRNGCVFSDSHCLGLHRAGNPSVCRSLRESTYWECPTGANALQLAQSVAINDVWAQKFHLRACGLCATKQLEEAGVTSLKVVGRCDETEDIAESVRLLSVAVHVSPQCASDFELFRSIERPQPHEEHCGRVQGMACYYPKPTYMDPMGGMR